jgi:hypothetical protein
MQPRATAHGAILRLSIAIFIPGLSLPVTAAEQTRRSPFAGVAALDKPVTISETKIPLGELVQKVAAETGVSLTASPEVADEPVAVVVKELPARELLEQVAELLDYTWVRQARPCLRDHPGPGREAARGGAAPGGAG